MENLEISELLVAKKIVKKGLLKAAESLSFFMKETVGINELEFEVNNHITGSSKTGNNIHVLTTEVIGDLPGVCYLIFSKDEADKLRDMALPAEIKNDPAMVEEMNEAIMLEVDNIISASVITEFSNILKHKIYGNVPSMKLVDSSELNKLIEENRKKEIVFINFKTEFVSTTMNFSPEFLWMFDGKFIGSIKNLSSNADLVESLN
jgi:chemotaxis protein CheY-P-specific phosphatase CheC